MTVIAENKITAGKWFRKPETRHHKKCIQSLSECIFISTEESPPAAAEENAPTARSKRSEAVQSLLVLLHQTIYQLSTVGGCKPLPFARRSSGFSEFYEKVKPRSFDYIFRIVQNRCRPCWLSIETWRPFSAQKHHQSNC